MRTLFKALLVIVISSIIIFLLIIIIFICCIGYSNGDYRCLICNKWIEKSFILDIPIITTIKTHYYEKWYWDNINIEHEHDWTGFGCRRLGWGPFGGGCATPPDEARSPFYSLIPYVPDKQIAISTAKRITQVSPEERRKLLRCFFDQPRCDCIRQIREKAFSECSDEEMSVLVNELWLTLSLDKKMSLEDFHKLYQIWLKYHTIWAVK